MTPSDFKQTHLVHSYIRSHTTDEGDKIVWKCSHPLCHHILHVPKKNRSILIGRMSLCPKCEKTQFVLTSRDLDRKRPLCASCKSPQLTEESKNLIDDALKGVFGGAEIV